MLLTKWLAVVAILLANSASGYRILGIFPLPAKSHFILAGKLMKALAARGHRVDVINHFPLKHPPANYHDISVKGGSPALLNNVSSSLVFDLFQTSTVKRLTQHFGENACKLLGHEKVLEVIRNPPDDPPYDLVVLEVFTENCFLAFGRHLKVPMVGLSPVKFLPWFEEAIGNPENPAIVADLFHTLVHPMTFTERLGNTLAYFQSKLQFHYYVGNQDRYVRRYFGPGMPSVRDLSGDLALLLVNSHYTLNEARPTVPSVVEIAGLHVEDPDEKSLSPATKKWMDESIHGLVYCSFGSMVRFETFSNESLRTFFRAFENIAPVRVLLRVFDERLLPPYLPKNVKTQPWFPQSAVLAHNNTRAFVTHGGLMGTLESLYFGIPMVGIPLFGDQYMNMQTLAKKGVVTSLSLQDISVESLTNALGQVLNDPSYKKNAERLSELLRDRPMSPLDTAIYWVEFVARHGNVLKSAASELHWWQVALLDVYAFLSLCLLSLIYATRFLCRKLTFESWRKPLEPKKTR